MLSRYSMLLVTVAVLNGRAYAVEDLQWLDGYCGAETARFTLNRFGISERTDDVRQLDSLESASIAMMRRAFESEKLTVRSYVCESVGDAAWRKLNRLVRTDNAVVLVLASQSSLDGGFKHYFVLSGMLENQFQLLDPRINRN